MTGFFYFSDKGDFYILRAKGDSMVDAGIDEDDLLVIERNCPALKLDFFERHLTKWPLPLGISEGMIFSASVSLL